MVTFRKSLWRLSVSVIVLGGIVTFLATGCSPGYVMRAAYEQSKILLARQEISDALDDASVSDELKEKLRIVLASRGFAESIGLAPGDSFTKFADIGKDTLAWVVVASRKDSFQLHTWWFPIVGRVPYKGYFDLDDARAVGKELEAEGYEAFIRGTDAFSTLGWFNDPVLSTTLQGPKYRIANTVIHESVHSTVWIKGNVPFNESFANFVGNEGAVQFFNSLITKCLGTNDCGEGLVAAYRSELSSSEKDRAFQFELAQLIDLLYSDLDQLYKRVDLTFDEKMTQREEVFAKHVGAFKQRYPELKALQKLNNAEIIQLKLYLSQLDLFNKLFDRVKREWGAFMDAIKEIASSIEREEAVDPFNELKSKLGD
jgi:predicted aminopeptidase